MTTIEPTDGSFAIHPDVAKILEMLRDNRMQWVADDVEGRILEGIAERSSFEQLSKKKRKVFEDVRGLTTNEQITILLNALRNYVILPPRLWNEAKNGLLDAINTGSQKILEKVEIVPPGDNVESINVTDPKMEAIVNEEWQNIESLLNKSRFPE